MSKKLISLVLVLVFCVGVAQAETILLVSDCEFPGVGGGDHEDDEFVAWLESLGFTVDTSGMSQDYRTLDAGKIANMESADLVIVSRRTSSGNYDDGSEIQQWNELKVPLILCSGYLTRNNRWDWHDSGSDDSNPNTSTDMTIIAGQENHPFLKGLTGPVQLFDWSEAPTAGQWPKSVFLPNSDFVAGSTLIGRYGDDDQQLMLGDIPQGTAFLAGSGVAGGRRAFFGHWGYDMDLGAPYDREANWDDFITEDYKTLLKNIIYDILGISEAEAKATNPGPAHEQTDVYYKTVCTWTAGIYAPATNGHEVFFSDDWNDVNDEVGGIIQTTERYPEVGTLVLDFDKTHYWKVNEANGTAPGGWDVGDIWEFTTEPLARPLPDLLLPDGITDVNASSEFAPVDNTANGTGLDADDEHSNTWADMWASEAGGGGGAGNPSPSGSTGPAWIAFEFDKLYKLHEMWVWNYNAGGMAEYGGLRNVTIEYSADGTSYTKLGDYEFAIATGLGGYAHNTEVTFSGVAAKYVVITAHEVNGNWYPIPDPNAPYGLSEVRFYYIPTYATMPNPADGTTVTNLDVVLSFRPGRDAAQHDVYFSTDQQAVIDGTAPVNTVTEPSYGPVAADLGGTYYWKTNEVNLTETPDTWVGDVWSFSTPAYLVVDDMESYDDRVSIEAIWRDGYICVDWGDPQQVPPVTGGCSGSVVDVNSGVGGGTKAMVFNYDNDGETFVPGYPGWYYPAPKYSEVEASTSGPNSLEFSTDWSSAKALWLEFYGDPANAAGSTEQMYVKLNNSKVLYDGPMSDIQEASWHRWTVDLSSFGINLQNVTTIAIGFGNQGNQTPGGSGVVHFDNIELHPSECVPERGQPQADLNDDCVVNYEDVEIMAGDWLAEDHNELGKLLLHWAFEDGFGNTEVSDSSGNNHTGVISGATWFLGGCPASPTYCLDFNGTGDYVLNEDVNEVINGSRGLTVCVWVNSDVNNTDKGFIIFDDPVGNDDRDMRYDAGGATCGGTNLMKIGASSDNPTNNGRQQLESSDDTQVVGVWQHLAMTWSSGNEVELYIDGAKDPTTCVEPGLVGVLDGYTKLLVGKGGKDDAANESWDGKIDDVRIYNYALSEIQIGTVMAGGSLPEPVDVYYPVPSPAELYDGENQNERKINFRDHAILANEWLDELFWP